MKRLIAAIAAAVLGVGSVLGATWTDSKGYKWTYVVNGSSSEITGVSSSVKGEVTIPPTLGGKNVSSIGESVFKDRTDVTGVTFPESLVSIGAFAFQGCTGLTLLQFPGTLDFIDYQAFRGCTKLETVIFAGDKAMEVVDEAFLGCSKLYTVYYNGSSIANWVMSDFATPTSNPLYYATDFYCPYLGGALTKLSVPAGVTRIGDNVFYLQRLDSVTIPDSVTSIGEGAFAYSYVDEVTIQGYSLRTIGKLAFSSSDFTSFSVPPGVTTIGEKAFSGCRHLSTVEIPESVTSIGYHAFALLGDSEPRAPSTVVVDYILSDLLLGKSEEDRVKAMLEDSGCDTTGIEFKTDLLTYCIVNFDENGGAIGSGVQLLNTRRGGTENVTTWDPPTWAGHEFLGWFTERTGGTQVTSSFVLKEKRYTFYAQWTVKQYKLSFVANGGSVTPAYKMVDYCKTYGELPTPTWGGHEFLGWFTAKTGGTQVTASTKCTGNKTIYAQWKVKQYTLKFDANGGKVSPASALVDYCATYDTFPTPTWSGHTFNGWYTARSGGTQVTAPWKCTGNKTIYAQWTVKQYKLTFNANGGTVSPGYKMVDYCKTCDTFPTPTWSGHTFNGWFTARSGGTKVTAPWKCTGGKTIYAQWTAKQYTITYNANGGTVSPASQKVAYCATYTLPTPKWSGHTFDGWYTAKTGGTKVTSPAKCTGNATLYARWK